MPLLEAERAIARKTQMERDRIWQQWNTYWQDINPCPEPNNIWINICSSKHEAIAKCQSYLADYVEFSTVDVPTLDSSPRHRARGPVGDIESWITDKLAKKAEDIPCDAKTRLAFHAAVLLSNFGFRPGSIMPLKYRDVRLGFISDPADPAQNRLIGEVTIRHNKQRTDKVYMNQKHTVCLLLSSIPCHPICLITLLAVQALHDNAFDVSFSSFDELLKRPTIEHGRTLWLKWKPEFLNRERRIINIEYFKYLEIWNRTWLVVGNRTSLRPYSLRVGAGAKFDALQNSSLERDPGAPLYPTAAELAAFETRKDLQELRRNRVEVRKQYRANSPQAHQAQAKIRHLIAKLSDAAVARAREAYFNTLDRLRADGLETAGRLPVSPPNPKTSHFSATFPAARAIGIFLQCEETRAGQQRSQFAAMLLAFLGGRVMSVHQIAQVQQEAVGLTAGHSFCLCSRHFAQRSNLTRHHRAAHINKGAFNQPFPCPECQRQGKDCIVRSVEEWSNHTEKFHGRQYTPDVAHSETSRLQSKVQEERGERDARCYVCGGMFFPGRSFSRHFNKEHVRAGRFDSPLQCWGCGDQDQIDGLLKWQTHVKVVHSCDPETRAKLSEGDAPKKRGLDADCHTARKRQRVHIMANDFPIDPRLLL
ncbi:hypothetical protein QBC44DRAFT_359145 [Cladorrhinum sp. PSN332]|nr:hypothetical protein QBC44DRAFT_359145 [Cladorrhinum sp. PSN332]